MFAAGLGRRLRPLTDHVPKPLLEVGGRTLLDRHLAALAEAGFRDVVINTAHLAGQIQAYVGDGSRWGLRVAFSHEADGPLETGGGLRRALPALGDTPFLAVNADILCAYRFAGLRGHRPAGLAHLVLVPNPEGKAGDFALHGGRVLGRSATGLTFSGIAVYDPALVAGEPDGVFSVVPLLERAMTDGAVTGERFDGFWLDVGTPERLRAARELHRPGS